MLRLHKQNTDNFEPFYKSLEDIDSFGDEQNSSANVFRAKADAGSHLMLEKYSHLFQNLISFTQDLEEIKSASDFVDVIKNSIRRLIPVKEADIFYFDEMNRKLSSLASGNKEISDTVNSFYKEGILNILFESKKPVMLPELKSFNSQGPKLNYIIYPVYEEKNKKGVFVILTSIPQNSYSEYDKHFIGTLLSLGISKADKFLLKNKVNTIYDELQTYQAKLSNDFRLSAIGELTEGIVEDIMNPLQVILSQADMIFEDTNSAEAQRIKAQVKKIYTVVNRLTKFSSINQKNVQIQPCNLNLILNDYHELIKSTLDNVGMELVMDLDEVVPPILTHQNYIYQILTNIFGLIKKSNFKSGGILIQTRFKNDDLILKIITTNKLDAFNPQILSQGKTDLNIKIVDNLMKKHEGNFIIESFEEGGSVITCRFPLKRKVIL